MLTEIDEMPIKVICQNLPVEFRNMMTKCRQMEHDEKPDYNYFIRMIKKIMMRNGI